MYWINGLYTVTVGGVNQFLGANPAAGRANGTQITDAFLNDIQGENLNFLTAANITPQPNNPTQVKQATDFLYGLKYGILNANHTVTIADRGTIFQCQSGTSTITVPAASGFDQGFIIGFNGGSGAPTTVNVSVIDNNGELLNGANTFTLANASSVILQAQGVNWGILTATADLEAPVHGSQVYTANGTWVCPPGITSVTVRRMIAGGAGGGPGPATAALGGSGGGAGQCIVNDVLAVTPGTSYPVVVGAPGAGGVVGGAAATAGMNSSFNGVTAAGGSPGNASSTTGGAAGGSGATAGSGGYYNGTLVFGGNGGGTLFSSPTPGGIGATGYQPNASAYGCGGAGGTLNTNGGNGGGGVVELVW